MTAMTRLQILRGTTAQRLSFVPKKGELVMDLDSNYLYIGDGLTAGGILAAPLAAVADRISTTVKNMTGSLIIKGTPLYVVGYSGGLISVAPGDADDTDESDISFVADSDISDGSTGLGLIGGLLTGVDTSAIAEGDSVYLAAGGGFTGLKPSEPNFVVHIGNVVRQHVSNGSIVVQIAEQVELPNLPHDHVPLGVGGGNTITVNLFNSIRATVLTGVSFASAAVITSADTILSALGKLQKQASDSLATLTAHIANVSNPHGVTKTQVGLSNVPNVDATQRANHTGTQLAATISDLANAVRTTVLTGLDTSVNAVIVAADTVLGALGKLQKQITDNLTTLSAHIANVANPHGVTKAQVGLSNADNTSDVNKPVSTAQAAADSAVQAFSIQRANHTGTQTAATISDFSTAADARISLQKGAANGLTPLGADSKIPSIYLPALAISDTFVVGSQAAQVALTAETGDVAVRTDLNKSYILRVNDPTIFANWQELLTPTDAVLSVNGQTGIVVLTTSNISEGSNLYFTTARVLATALSGLSITGGAVIATDTVLAAFGKVQNQINNILSTVLTGFAASTNTAVTSADTLLQALQKLQAQVTAREAAIAGTTSADFWSGAKTFINFASTVLSTVLTGFVASTNTAVAATDTALQALQKLQAQVTAREGTITAGTTAQYWRGDKTFQDFLTAVQTTLLTGYVVGANTALAATDNIIQALQKIQGQINARALAARQIINGYGITGGGDFTADRTLAVSLSTAVIEQTASVASTTTADSLISGFTVNAPSTGSYLAIISARVESNSGDGTGTARMFANGVAQTATIRSLGATASFGDADVRQEISIFKLLSLTAGQAVDLRWAHSVGGFNILDRSITLVRIS